MNDDQPVLRATHYSPRLRASKTTRNGRRTHWSCRTIFSSTPCRLEQKIMISPPGGAGHSHFPYLGVFEKSKRGALPGPLRTNHKVTYHGRAFVSKSRRVLPPHHGFDTLRECLALKREARGTSSPEAGDAAGVAQAAVPATRRAGAARSADVFRHQFGGCAIGVV